MHPVLAVFSLGLLATSVLFDVVGLASQKTVWAAIALEDLHAGLAGSAAAGVLAVAAVVATRPGSRARPLAVLRASAHLSGLTFFAGALALRRMDHGPFPSTTALVLSAAGLALGALAAWLTAGLAGRLSD